MKIMSRKMIGNLLVTISCILILTGCLLRSMKKEYFFHEYGFGCKNVVNNVSSSFEVKETIKVHFNFYCKADGKMSVKLKDSLGTYIFQSEELNFKEKYTMILEPGQYFYDIDYSDLCGDFELMGAVYKILGITI